MFNGKLLLAGVLGWGESHLEHAIKVQNVYDIHKKPKKSGGVRIISVPHPALKEFQRRFLRYFLYRILKQGWISPRIHGFIPKRSHLSNAQFHARPHSKHVVRLDLKDAFPSVTAEMVRDALWRVLMVEVLRYRLISMTETERREYPQPVLFSSKRKVKWFRKFFGSKPWPRWLGNIDPYDVLRDFVNVLVPLVTFNGSLPQGAPTSPFLLNLVLSHYDFPRLAYEWFKERSLGVDVSVYADDFTISSAAPISKEAIHGFMAAVEEHGLFRFNRDKTLVFDHRQTAPLVTGLRIVHTEAKNGRSGTVKVGLPKRKLRKIRGIIHRAIIVPKLRAKADGYIAYLKGIYGSKFPNQVAVPCRRYCEFTGKKI